MMSQLGTRQKSDLRNSLSASKRAGNGGGHRASAVPNMPRAWQAENDSLQPHRSHPVLNIMLDEASAT